MRHYEMMIILDGELDERTVQPSLEKFLSVVTKDGGTVDNVDVWGRRRLAYEIAKKNEGLYAVVNFTSSADAAKELDRQLGLSEAVLRTKVLRAEEGMAQVAARHWLAQGVDVPEPEAAAMISTLAWRGLGSFPKLEA